MGRSVILLLIAIFSIVVECKSQKIVVGIKGGIDFAKISGKSFLSNYSPSFEGGGYVRFRLNSVLGLQTELLYSQQIEKINIDKLNVVYNYNGSTINSLVNGTATIGSISLPILLTYRVNNLISVTAGPAVSLNAYTDENIFQNGTVAFKQNEISFCGGANLNLNGFSFYLRYNHGLSNINNYNSIDTWKSRRMSFGLEIPIKSFK